ncbi:MAG: hypothetical protein ABIP97_05585 [Chthoniobacterales bacterium]
MTEFAARLHELKDLYRFSLILSNEPLIAEQVLDQCLQDILKNPGSDPQRTFMTLVLNLRKRIFQKVKPSERPLSTGELPAGAASSLTERSPEELRTALHRLSEPERSAYTLWHLDLMEHHDLAKLLGLTEEDVSLKIQSARLSLLLALTETPAPEAV